MDLFCGAELAFSDTYFPPRPSHVVKINTDLPVKTLVSTEVPPSAGSFAVSEPGFQSRFILWRADGSNLFLDEFAIDRDLVDPRLCINFSQSLIVPGTRLFIVRHKIFLLIVPTQSGIHRFYVHLERDKDDSLGNFSLLSRLHEAGELYANHDFHAWKQSAGVATKVAVGVDPRGLATVAAVCTMDRHLLRVVFPTLSPIANEATEETLLQNEGGAVLLKRLFAKPIVDCWEMAVLSDARGRQRIFNLSRDGRLRVFGDDSSTAGTGGSARVLASVDIGQLVPQWSQPHIVDVAMKPVPMGGGGKAETDMLLLHITLAKDNLFVILQQCKEDKLAVVFSTTLDQAYVRDFLCTVQQTVQQQQQQQQFTLWAIVADHSEDDLYYEDISNASKGGEQDDMANGQRQPYTLRRCQFVGGRSAKQPPPCWEDVRAASTAGTVDSLLFKFPHSEGIRNRVFDGNNYAFEVVQRAVQVICKQPQKHIEHGNWLALSRLLDEFLASGQYKQLYLESGRDDGDTLLDYGTLRDDAKLRKAYEQFWADFLRTCNQLQEESLRPLAIWQSAPAGLTGVIQMCRFTVFSPPDPQLRAICEPTNQVARRFFDLVRANARANLKDPWKTLELVNNNMDELCRLIIAFATQAAPKGIGGSGGGSAFKVPSSSSKSAARSPYLNSSFTVGLVAMALRTRIWARLKLAWLINSLNEIVPQILIISTEARVDPKLDMVISAYNCTIAHLTNYYTTMWVALSVRLISHEASGHSGAPPAVPKQLNVAQAFLRSSSQLSGNNRRARAGPEGTEEEEDQDEPPSADDDEFGDELNEEEMFDQLDQDRTHLAAEQVEEEEEEEQGEEGGEHQQHRRQNGHGQVGEEQQMLELEEAGEEQPPPPSRWDQRSRFYDGRNRRRKTTSNATQQGLTQFGQFFGRQLDSVLARLWPESETMTLPRFLAESKFFDALKNYCSLNEPFAPELANTFRFFQAIALSGQGRPEAAWAAFEEVAAGILGEDEVLNRLLDNMYPSPSIVLAASSGAADEAEKENRALKKAGGSSNSRKHGNEAAEGAEDQDQIRKHSLLEYYNKVMFIFKEHKHPGYVVLAGEKAINFAKPGDELLTSEVYTTLFTQHLVARQYLDALSAVLSTPNGSRQSVCLRQLVTHLLDTRETRVLVQLSYGPLTDLVTDILETRCRAEPVTGQQAPMYDVGYAFHVQRCEFNRAAKLMYELANRLRQEIQSRTMLLRRCNALATVYQTMQIDELEGGVFECEVEQRNQFEEDEAQKAATVAAAAADRRPQQQQALDNGIEGDFAMVDMVPMDSESMAAAGGSSSSSTSSSSRQAHHRTVTLNDIARELLKVEARLALSDADPMLLPPLGDEEILRQSLRYKRYDMAWMLIREFELKPYDLLAKVTEEALRVDNNEEEAEEDGQDPNSTSKEEPEWVMFNRNFVRELTSTGGEGGGQKSHWRVVISYLDLAMKLFPHDTAILRTVANTFLKFSIKLPPWLVQRYSKVHFGDLLRALIDYDELTDAFQLLLSRLDEARQQLKQIVVQHIRNNVTMRIVEEEAAQLLPYTHIETLLQLAERSEERSKLPIAETMEKLKQFHDYQRSMTRTPAAEA